MLENLYLVLFHLAIFWCFFLLSVSPITQRTAPLRRIVSRSLKSVSGLIALIEAVLWSFFYLWLFFLGLILFPQDLIYNSIQQNIFLTFVGFSIVSVPLVAIGISGKFGPFSCGGLDKSIYTRLIDNFATSSDSREQWRNDIRQIWLRARIYGNPRSQSFLSQLAEKEDDLGRFVRESIDYFEKVDRPEFLSNSAIPLYLLVIVESLVTLALITYAWVNLFFLPG